MGIFKKLKPKSDLSKQLALEAIELQEKLFAQDLQIASIQSAERIFEETGDIGELIKFWENIWGNDGLLFRGSKWTFRLPDLYIKVAEYDKALKILKKMRDPNYLDKRNSYIEKVNKLKEKQSAKR